jgi:hypothetical protein
LHQEHCQSRDFDELKAAILELSISFEHSSQLKPSETGAFTGPCFSSSASLEIIERGQSIDLNRIDPNLFKRNRPARH